MVVTARMSGLKSVFSTNSLLLQLQVFIASVDPWPERPPGQAMCMAGGEGLASSAATHCKSEMSAPLKSSLPVRTLLNISLCFKGEAQALFNFEN